MRLLSLFLNKVKEYSVKLRGAFSALLPQELVEKGGIFVKIITILGGIYFVCSFVGLVIEAGLLLLLGYILYQVVFGD